MVLDRSAVMAILLLEPETNDFLLAVARAPIRMISAATLLELFIVSETRRGKAGAQDIDRFVAAAGIEIVPFNAEQALVARDAWRRYGRGNHRAGLNFGDCFAYALAKVSGEPLLCKGNDFARTNIAVWRAPGETS